MKFLVVNVDDNVDILETPDCCQAISEVIMQVENGVSAELFVEKENNWYGWNLVDGFIGPRPKTPPTR